MILRDPVHGLIAFEGAREQVVQRLLATREVQRLRRIRQLGLASLVFPGAEHSRFAHAVGTAFVMTRLLDRISQLAPNLPQDQRLDPEAERDALAAALLHDLGHGPFSHLFEDVMSEAPRHEQWTEELLRDSDSEVHAALESLGRGTAERVAKLVRGEHRLDYLAQAVSGTLDVDRADYLLRDSHMTGVRYGIYDLDWLLRALTVAELPRAGTASRFVLAIEGRKGLPPIEGFFLARNFMYQQVYHHKAVRASEVLLRAIFVRVAELLHAGNELPVVPRGLAESARGQHPSLADYYAMDDASVSHAIARLAEGPDAVLADLSRRFLARVLPKTLPLPDGDHDEPLWQRAYVAAQQVAEKHGLRPDLYVWLDVPSDVPYGEPGPDDSSGLWVSLRHRPLSRLGDVSFLLRQLRNKRTVRPRLVFPAELRGEIGAAVDSVIGA
jgi:HD superfamily phosphohydrolase